MTENLQKQWGRIYAASSWIFKKCSVLPFPAHMPDTYLPSGWKSACPFWVWLSRGLFYKLESSCRSQCTCLEHSVCTWEEGKQCFGFQAFCNSKYISWAESWSAAVTKACSVRWFNEMHWEWCSLIHHPMLFCSDWEGWQQPWRAVCFPCNLTLVTPQGTAMSCGKSPLGGVMSCLFCWGFFP